MERKEYLRIQIPDNEFDEQYRILLVSTKHSAEVSLCQCGTCIEFTLIVRMVGLT